MHQFTGSWCGVPTIVGNYLIQSVPAIHGFVVLDISDGEKVREVAQLVIDNEYASHWSG